MRAACRGWYKDPVQHACETAFVFMMSATIRLFKIDVLSWSLQEVK